MLQPEKLSLLEQLRRVAAAPLALTPDGGISFLCAFLPRVSMLEVYANGCLED